MLHTTFRILHSAGASAIGYKKLVKHLSGVKDYGKDTPIPLAVVLESNGLSDALWCLRAVLPSEQEGRDHLAKHLAADYVEHALRAVFGAIDPNAAVPRDTIAIMRRFREFEAWAAAAGGGARMAGPPL